MTKPFVYLKHLLKFSKFVTRFLKIYHEAKFKTTRFTELADNNRNVFRIKVLLLQKVSICFFLRVINPFPNKPWFLRICCMSLLKTLWEKEKLLKIS